MIDGDQHSRLWELATNLRKEADRLEELFNDNKEVEEDQVLGYLTEMEAHISDIEEEAGIAR